MDIVVNIDGLRLRGWLKRDGRGSVPILNPLISPFLYVIAMTIKSQTTIYYELFVQAGNKSTYLVFFP